MNRFARDVGAGASALVAGVLFSVGLGLAGMTQPEKVQGFLRVFRAWDPSLLFVMGGAVLVHGVVLRLVLRRPSPVFAARFALPTRKDLDAKLLGGAALFGIGWGLGGFCPGPALASLATGAPAVLAFVAAMLAGTALAARLEDAATPSLTEVPARRPRR